MGYVKGCIPSQAGYIMARLNVCMSPSFNLVGQTQVWTEDTQTQVFEAIN